MALLYLRIYRRFILIIIIYDTSPHGKNISSLLWNNHPQDSQGSVQPQRASPHTQHPNLQQSGAEYSHYQSGEHTVPEAPPGHLKYEVFLLNCTS